METIVGVTRGTDKFESFNELLNITKFDENIQNAFAVVGSWQVDKINLICK